MSGGKAESRAKGDNAVVGTVGYVFVGNADGGLGGVADVGEGGDRWDGDCNGLLVNWGGYCSKHNLRDSA